jgi:hypothetical protein
MSHKRKRDSRSFSLERLSRKISDAKPSSSTLTIVLITYAIFLFGGGLFTIVSPLAPVYDGTNFIFIIPDLSQGQFYSETIISATLYVMGFIGVLALYQSTKYAFKPRQAYMWAIVGVSLLLMAYMFLEGIMLIKIG